MNGVNVTAGTAVSHAQQTMLYAQTNYFINSSYLRLNNRPVLLNFGPQYFTQGSQWTSIFSVLNATNQPTFFTEDNRLSAGAGAFNWPPMSLSQPTGGSNVLSDATLQSYLSSFDQKASAWPAFGSSAFPRFHDIYGQAGGTSYGYLSDNNGATFQETLARAMTNASTLVQVVTWNDFGEGTIVEPTVEYGYRDLGIVQDYRRQYLDAGFPYSTNDLTLAMRLYVLRGKYGSSRPVVSAELDRTFTSIVAGNLAAARLQLTGVESTQPALYNLALTNGQLEFAIGGYLSTNGIQIESTTDLTSSNWTVVSTLPVSTNQIVFDTPLQAEADAVFLRVRNNGP
jgi:hypothetical protein